jgi:hypothetical protein
MKCPVCDALLREGECADCLALTEALSALREEQLPPLAVNIPRRGRAVYPWVAAAAAAAVLILAFPYARRPEPPAPVKHPPALPALQVPEIRPAKAEPLRIKILTPDPNVVIYWLVTPKEGE